MREDMEQSKWWAVDEAKKETKRLLPTIREILAEAEEIRPLNPSASVVWAIQALEIFLKNALLKPYLHFRLGHETELADQISSRLFGYNGAKEAQKWLNQMFPIRFAERLLKSGQARIWNGLWSDNSAIHWRNLIIHRAYIATTEEAAEAIELVTEFVSSLEEMLSTRT